MTVKEFTEGSYIMLSVDFFWTKRSAKYDFLEITKYSTGLTEQIWAAKCD